MILITEFLPTDKIFHHVKNSASIYRLEGDNFFWAWGLSQTRIDNFTDSIMLLKAIYPVENVVDSAFLMPSWSWMVYHNSPTTTLLQAIDNDRNLNIDTWTYARYWHGYLVILKPALMLTTVQNIRMFNLCLQFFLIATAFVLMYKRLGIFHMYALMVALIVINPITAALNFQITDVFVITLLATIFILIKNEMLMREQNYLYFFMAIGIVTAYLDFLTYPITALGISLCVCVLMNKNFFFLSKPADVLKKLTSYFFSWIFGYGGMWAGKWILATLLTNENVIANALYTANDRVSTMSIESGLPQFEILKRVLIVLTEGGVLPFIAILLFIGLLWLLIVRKKKISTTRSMLITFAFIIFLPFLWLFTVKSHSYIHDFLSYKNLSVAVFGVICFFIESLKEKA